MGEKRTFIVNDEKMISHLQLKDYLDCSAGINCGTAYTGALALIQLAEECTQDFKDFFDAEINRAVDTSSNVGDNLATWTEGVETCSMASGFDVRKSKY